MELKNRKFAFCRADNHVLVRNIVLLENHYIAGNGHPNETYWEYKDNILLFKDPNGHITTTFHTIINLDGKLFCLGSYGEKHIWHILIEININEQINFQTHYNKLEQLINQQSTQIQKNLDNITLRSKRLEQNNNCKVKVVFLVHNSATWDSLNDVYQEMENNEKFEVIVASIPRCFPGEASFGHEQETHEFLMLKDIPHIRFTNVHNENINVIKYINPNAIFRQAPWDNDVPPEWSVSSLSFTNIFYIPYYGFNILENFLNDVRFSDAYSNLPFHKECAQIFCESDITKESMAKRSTRGGDNLVATGHPKLERLLKEEDNPSWPINVSDTGITRIIWAPHHSFADHDWLGFGLFKDVYQDMLEWVKSDPKIEVVLKPHPALFTSIVATKRLSKEKLDAFLTEWSELPNTALVEGGDYGPLMAASDIMLTEGVSFLAEYMIFWKKPLIFLKSKTHAPFNEIGKLIEGASYVVENVNDIKVLVYKLSESKNNDTHCQARYKVFQQLMPFEMGASKRIADSVYKFFRE